jgi:SAM-dependent methyltransferase
VDDRGQGEARLARLIAQSISPPLAERGGPGRIVRRRLLRLGRARAMHQHAVDTAIAQRLSELAEQQTRFAEQLQEIAGALAATSTGGDELRGRVGWLQEQVEGIDRRVPRDLPFTTAPYDEFTGPDGRAVTGFRGADGGEVYLGFENVFRGTEEDIAARQRAYLSLLAEHAPVLDVGCGRGELLALLRDDGVAARGVDLDPGMVDRCRAKGLDVKVADGVETLEGTPAESIGSVVAAQVIEHLPYDRLLRFLQAVHSALVPGGVVILETVNPHAPQALKQFWVDPTHQHPLFPEVVLTLLRLHGFVEAYIWFPLGSDDHKRDHAEQPDYVIVGTTPQVSR